MQRNQPLAEHWVLDPEPTGDLVALLNQTLADSLDLAYQTKQAYWNIEGLNFYALHQLFNQLYDQLVGYVDELAERVATSGGQALSTIRIAVNASTRADYSLNVSNSVIHVDALVDRYLAYIVRLHRGIHKAEQLGDHGTAELYTALSRAMEKALWMLKAHQG